MKTKEPRSKYCWECGKKLQRNRYELIYIERIIDGHPRILHKQCAELIKKGKRDD